MALSQLSIDSGDAPFGSLITKNKKLIICEPCPICSFMIREYKISRVVFALPSLYMGGYSKWKILQDTDLTKFNLFFGKPPEVIGSFMEDEPNSSRKELFFGCSAKTQKRITRLC